ncbi:hypothetical protein SO802_005269 [Lithocarpus litseifolius]|uniref:Uncharacterized protein n=1 Tax=Lithocarpus litseifolius TaxID=425828 RepID=A0AAW2DNA8_9ROSI
MEGTSALHSQFALPVTNLELRYYYMDITWHSPFLIVFCCIVQMETTGDPGPIDNVVLYDQDSYVSSVVWAGQGVLHWLAYTFVGEKLAETDADFMVASLEKVLAQNDSAVLHVALKCQYLFLAVNMGHTNYGPYMFDYKVLLELKIGIMFTFDHVFQKLVFGCQKIETLFLKKCEMLENIRLGPIHPGHNRVEVEMCYGLNVEIGAPKSTYFLE